MRVAWLSLVLLGACSNDDAIDLVPIPPCTTCTAGHLRAGVAAQDGSRLAWDGASLVAWRGHTVHWLSPELDTVRVVSAWARDSDQPRVEGVASAADGHAFLLEAADEYDVVGEDWTVIALDGQGRERWQDPILRRAHAASSALAVAADGDLVALAFASNTPTVVPGQAVDPRIRIAKLGAADGQARWVKRWDDPQITATGVAPLAGGDLVVVGTLDGKDTPIDLGGASGTLIGPGMFVVRLGSSGDVVWSRAFGGSSYAGARGVAVGDGDRIYVLGDFSSTLDLGNGTVLAPPPDLVDAHDVVIAMDGAGTIVWTATPTFTSVSSLAATARGVMVGVSSTDAAVQIGGVTLPRGEASDAACVELVGGDATWSLSATGAGYQSCDPAATIGGRPFVVLTSWGPSDGPRAHMTVDGHTFEGDTRVLAEVVGSATVP